MYIIHQGTIELTHSSKAQGEVVIGTLCYGDAVGHVPFFFRMRQLCGARAGTSGGCVLFRIQHYDYQQLLKLYPEEEEVVTANVLADMEQKNGDALEASGAGENVAVASMFARAHKAVLLARKQKKQSQVVAMVFAAMKGDLATLRRILTLSDITVSDGDFNGRTPLHLAAAEGHLTLIQILVNDFGAEINCQDAMGHTPLGDAVREKNDDVAAFLRTVGAEMRCKNPAALLCKAAAAGDVDELRRLMDNGINCNVFDYDKRTPLHLAASEGQLAAVTFLLSLPGIQLDPEDRWGGTPLVDALRHRQKHVLEALRHKGATLGSRDVGTQLCSAAASMDLDALTTLLDNGADPNAGDYDQRTALHLAASNGHVEVVDLLLACKGIDANPLDRLGGTPLEDALRGNHLGVADMLRAAGGKMQDDPSLADKLAQRRAFLREQKAEQSKQRTLRALAGTRESRAHRLLDEVAGTLDEGLEAVQREAYEFLAVVQDLMGMSAESQSRLSMMDMHTRAVYRRSREQKVARLGESLVSKARALDVFVSDKGLAAVGHISPLVHAAHPKHDMVMELLGRLLKGLVSCVTKLLEAGAKTDFYWHAAAEKLSEQMWSFLTDLGEDSEEDGQSSQVSS
eukprot:jgi/Mesvir1/7138/Mv25133-RA.1